jgi:hypothetical protein
VPPPLPTIDPGKRCTVAGRTGSGKTTLAAWFLNRSAQHWVVLNPKHTAIYRALPGAVIHRKFDPKAILSDTARRKFVVLELSGDEAESNYMDGIIGWLHGALHNVGLCVDELYTLHSSGGRAGAGLTGWLTRGREYRQSFLGLTQRPAWISLFVFTEAEYICAMDLTHEDDRERLYKAAGDRHFLDRVTGYRWLCYDVLRATIHLYGPVPPLTNTSQESRAWAPSA